MTYQIDKVPQVVIDEVKRLDGFYVGFLDDEEIEMFDLCVEAGIAARDFNHPGGVMGLAKVKML